VNLPNEENAQLVAIYLSEDARYGGKPAYAAILEMLRREGASGATVMRGLAGFSMDGRIHTAAIEALSAGLPLKIEWVDTPTQVQRLLPALRRMTGKGVITVQEVTMAYRTSGSPQGNILERPVAEIMQRNVVSVKPDTRLSEAVSLLLRRGLRSLPVTDVDGRVIGIVTDGDLLRNTSLPIRLGLQPILTREQIQTDIRALQSQGRTVGEIMTMPVVTVHSTDTVRTAGAVMVEHDLKRLPVVNRAGHLAGIVSRVDILREMSSDVALAASTPEPLPAGHTVTELMNPDAPAVSPRAGLEEIVQALERGRQQRVIVVNESGQVIGVITDGDLLRRSMYGKHPSLRERLRGLITGKSVASFALPEGNETAAELMTTPAVTVDVEAPLSEALRIMLVHRLKRLPVVDRQLRLLGVLGRSSVLRGLMDDPPALPEDQSEG